MLKLLLLLAYHACPLQCFQQNIYPGLPPSALSQPGFTRVLDFTVCWDLWQWLQLEEEPTSQGYQIYPCICGAHFGCQCRPSSAYSYGFLQLWGLDEHTCIYRYMCFMQQRGRKLKLWQSDTQRSTLDPVTDCSRCDIYLTHVQILPIKKQLSTYRLD